MQIHVARQSAQLGVFTAEEVLTGLQSGRFLLTDLGWREGMANWSVLGEWPEFRSAVVPPLPSDAVSAVPSGPMPAWEREASFGSFFATIRDVALNPVRTFDALPHGGYGKPIRYAYATSLPVWCLLTAVFAVIFFFMWAGLSQELRNDPGTPPFLVNLGPGVLFAATTLFFAFLFAIAPWLHFVFTGVMHLLLLPWRPQGGFAQTYRASSYVLSALTLPQLIPCVNYVAAVWQAVVLVIALARVHRLDWWKVLLSLFVIPFTCCCLFGALIPVLSRLAVR